LVGILAAFFGILLGLGWVEVDAAVEGGVSSILGKICAKGGRPAVRNLPKGTCARYIDKPRVNTLWVELVVAWQNPQVLALDKVIGTDRAGEVTAIGGSIGVRFVRGSCSSLDSSCMLSGRHFSLAGSRLLDVGNAIRAGRGMLAGGILHIGHLDVPLGGSHTVVVAKLDDGKCVDEGLRYTSCSTLPWPASDPARSISLGMTVRTDGAGDDDAQEEGGNDTCDTVQDNHRCKGVVNIGPVLKAVRNTRREEYAPVLGLLPVPLALVSTGAEV
jgi:hypothetical protein